jgi:basic membrane lipoprotein Med (substrate-binding protein (PBP1-ABC) superfamily)
MARINLAAASLAMTVIFAIFAISGCSKNSPQAASSDTDSNDFKVALLTPGPVSDAGWNASAYDGLKSIETHLGAKTAMVQTASPADFEDAFRDFASRGFKLVFGHGFEYTDTALRVAKLYPGTTFVVTSGSGSSTNVASVTFKIEEAAYVLGVLAGSASKSGVAGAVGGIELPAIRLTFDGYRRGFVTARPDGKVLTSFIGSFEDVGAAKEAALAQISRGADFIFHNADAAGLGVFQAAAQSKVFAFGSNRNQNDIVPDAVLASAVTDIPGAFLRIATEVKSGTFKPAMIEYGMKDSMVEVVFNARLTAKIDPRAIERANAATRDIVEGRIVFPALAGAK